jgi:serine phosphatase RsbU (regulator of sigma subunit)
MNGRMFALEGSFPLGVVAKPNFSVSYLQLQEGDDLTLYTDGVLEAQSRSGEIFGFDRTAQLLRSRPDVNAIAEAARSFGQQDDITVVKITRTFRSEPIINVSADLCSKSA